MGSFKSHVEMHRTEYGHIRIFLGHFLVRLLQSLRLVGPTPVVFWYTGLVH